MASAKRTRFPKTTDLLETAISRNAERSHDDFPAEGVRFDGVSTELQDCLPLVRVFGPVVHATHTADVVVKRLLDHVGAQAVFVQPRRGGASQIVNREGRNLSPLQRRLKGGIDGVMRDGFVKLPPWHDQFAAARQRLHFRKSSPACLGR